MRINRTLRVAAIPAVVGSLAFSAHTQTVSLSVNLRSSDPNAEVNFLLPGDPIWFDLAIAVDPAADPNNTGNGNKGLATFFFDVVGFETMAQNRILNGMVDAFSGFDASEFPRTIAAPYIGQGLFRTNGARTDGPGYAGGWGFDRAGLPGGGDLTTDPGTMRGAGIMASLTWTADVSNNFGFQPKVRQGVGHGAYTFPPEDPIAGGLQGGFGQDLSDPNNIIEGDGSWLFQFGSFDTTGWPLGTYNFDVDPIAVALYDGSLDYTNDLGSGFRVEVELADVAGTSFSFTLISLAPCSGTCGDINGSGGSVNLQDFATFALCFNKSSSSSQACDCSDLNGDGTINLFDFATFGLLFGSTSTNTAPNCP